MTESPSTRIHYLIRQAARRDEPVFEVYRLLRKLHTDQNIDYLDFEWKYYQYYHGCSDLNMERSPDSPNPVTFEDLPVDVLGKVVGTLELRDCLTLRKVTSNLCKLVDSSEVHCRRINMHFDETSSRIETDDVRLVYEKTVDGGCTVTSYRKDTKQENKFTDDRNFKQALITDASTFFGNPKLKIGHIGFRVGSDEAVAEFVDYLTSLKFPLDARSFHYETGECILPILHSFNPEQLEEITFKYVEFTLEQFNELVEMEQLLKSKIRLLECRHPTAVGIEKMVDFKAIESSRFQHNDANLINIRDILLKSPHLKSFRLNEYCDTDQVPGSRMREIIDRIMSQDPAYDAQTRRFSIPDSRDYFQLKLEVERSGSDIDLIIRRISVP